MGTRRFVGLGLVAVFACTEPNPFVDADTGTQTDAATAGSATSSATSSATTSADSTPGDSDTSMTSATTNDPTLDSSGEPACAIGTHTCVPAAPEGWSGPVALVDDTPEDPDPGCLDPFPTPSTVVYDGLVAPPADCTCTCGDAVGETCTRVLVVDNSAGCATPTNEWDIGSGCVSAVVGAANQYWRATTEPLTGTCGPPQFGDEIVDAEFSERHTLCAADEVTAGACAAGDVCTPIPIAPFTADALCIWADGDLECPMDLGYDTRRLTFRDFTDDRACATCSCDLVGECTGTVYLFSDSCDSMFASATLTLNGACLQVPAGIENAENGAWDVDASCQEVGGTPMGAANGTEPVTICCRG
jgi:hypothetical protein